LVREIPGWTVEEKSIERTFDFPDFARAMEFGLKVGELAEREDHHPELCVSWGQTRVVFSTHKIDGLSRNDFILAAKVDQLATGNEA
jgi:4a-hydroxytetrahydrobiopterin dehydratase